MNAKIRICYGLNWRAWIGFPLALIVLTGCARDSNNPAKLTLYSIDGREDRRSNDGTVTETKFHGYPIVGKTQFDDPETCREILRQIDLGRKESDGSMAKCFWPRHGVHVEYKDGSSADFVICFTCLQLKIYEKGDVKLDTTSRAPMSYFNDLLEKADIEIVDLTKPRPKESPKEKEHETTDKESSGKRKPNEE